MSEPLDVLFPPRATDPPKLDVTCPECGHVAHTDRCRQRLSWWQRLWRGRSSCHCVPWGPPK